VREGEEGRGERERGMRRERAGEAGSERERGRKREREKGRETARDGERRNEKGREREREKERERERGSKRERERDLGSAPREDRDSTVCRSSRKFEPQIMRREGNTVDCEGRKESAQGIDKERKLCMRTDFWCCICLHVSVCALARVCMCVPDDWWSAYS